MMKFAHQARGKCFNSFKGFVWNVFLFLSATLSNLSFCLFSFFVFFSFLLEFGVFLCLFVLLKKIERFVFLCLFFVFSLFLFSSSVSG